MCRTVHALLSTVICGIQMLVRVFMTIILMFENLIRMLLQTLYNFISFLLQLISLLPICCVFLITSRLKCFMCGGGGPCPVNRGGTCDCLMSFVAIIILFFIFRATGVMDKIFYSMGYAKAPTQVARFVPTPGDVTECSRNDTEVTEYELDLYTKTLTMTMLPDMIIEGENISKDDKSITRQNSTEPIVDKLVIDDDVKATDIKVTDVKATDVTATDLTDAMLLIEKTDVITEAKEMLRKLGISDTTILYYIE